MKIINQEIKYILMALGIIILGMLLYFSLPIIPNVGWVYLSSVGLVVSTLRRLCLRKPYVLYRVSLFISQSKKKINFYQPFTIDIITCTAIQIVLRIYNITRANRVFMNII